MAPAQFTREGSLVQIQDRPPRKRAPRTQALSSPRRCWPCCPRPRQPQPGPGRTPVPRQVAGLARTERREHPVPLGQASSADAVPYERRRASRRNRSQTSIPVVSGSAPSHRIQASRLVRRPGEGESEVTVGQVPPTSSETWAVTCSRG